MRISIILFNLGGPTDSHAVRPFLFNLFRDKNIIRLPALFRYPLAYLISSLRYKKASKIYAKLGGASPINQETERQLSALAHYLKDQTSSYDFKLHYCMQYWHPMHEEVIKNVVQDQPEKVILLPLYPQFSTTTSKSSFEVWMRKSKALLKDIPHIKICCYPENPGFIKAYGDLIIQKLDASEHKSAVEILYSAHGIPQDCVDDGDPYEEQINKSAAAITAYLREKGYQNATMVTYQSKVGPKKWLEPDTETVIETRSQQKKPLLIVPIAFTSEHSETLVELDMDYQELATELGCPEYLRVPTVSANHHYIAGLGAGILNALKHNIQETPSICGHKFTQCPKKTALAPCIHI